ncbi:MAG: GNAT family N-acetyltransferase [Bacteroides sp.]|nr:GNAT family N-acetyltransferase [Bacteroides sp.]
MKKYIIKKMESEDEINGKGYVHYRSWHEAYAGLIDAAYLEQLTLEKCTDSAHKWTDNLLVAKDGERVVGFAGYGPYRDETLPSHGEVFSLYVLSEYQGKKIGYELMNAALDKLSDCERIAVWVLKGNDRAVRFYERYGFRMDGAESEIKLGTPNTVIRMIYERKK